MKNDIATNELIENADVFADILNTNVTLFQNGRELSPDDLEYFPVTGAYKDLDGKLHKSLRDTFMLWKKANVYLALIGVEAQTDINRIMPVRDMGYAFTAYMKQIWRLTAENRRQKKPAYTKGIHDDQKLLPVGTFILYFGEEEWDTPLSLMDILHIPDADRALWKELINDYKIHVISVARQPQEIREKYQSDFRVIADYMAYRKDRKKLENFFRYDQHKLIHTEQVLDLLEALSSDARFRKIKEAYQAYEEEEKEEINTMCLLLDMCENKGKSEGIIQGKIEDIFELLLDFGEIPATVKQTIQNETSPNQLSIWHKIAAKADSIDEFCQKAGM